MRATTIHETKIRKLTGLFLMILFLVACGTARLDPSKLKSTQLDWETVRFPPSTEELFATPKLILATVFKDESATESRLNIMLRILRAQFERRGNFKVISFKQINDVLSNTNAQKFSPDDIAETIEQGKALNASFILRIYTKIQDSVGRGGAIRFKAKVKLVAFGVDSGQMLFNREVLFDSQNLKKAAADLQKLIDRRFPIKAFVLETRGGRRVAKISAGRSQGIVLGRRFKAANKKVVIINGKPRPINTYSLTSAVVKVIQIMENDAWVEVKDSDQSKIRKGQAMFSMPEN